MDKREGLGMNHMILVLNEHGVWAGLPFLYASRSEAWEAAREERQFKHIRVVEIVGEIERQPPLTEGNHHG